MKNSLMATKYQINSALSIINDYFCYNNLLNFDNPLGFINYVEELKLPVSVNKNFISYQQCIVIHGDKLVVGTLDLAKGLAIQSTYIMEIINELIDITPYNFIIKWRTTIPNISNDYYVYIFEPPFTIISDRYLINNSYFF